MASMWKYLRHLNDRRTVEAEKALRENYSILMLASTLDMDMSPKYAAMSVVLAIFHYSILISTFVSLSSAAILLSYDFEAASGAGNLGLLIALAIGFLLNFHSLRYEFLDIHSMMGKGIYEYSMEQLAIDDIKVFQKKMNFQRILLVFLALYVCSISILVVMGPWLDNRFGNGYPTAYDKYGVNRQIPVPLYLPFENAEGIGYLAAMGITALSGAVTCLVIGATSLVFSMVSQYILWEQKKLSCSIKTLIYRAKYIYSRSHHVDRKTLNSKIYDNPEFQKTIHFCLRENVEHHRAILDFMKTFEHFAREPLLSSFLIVTVAIGLSMLKLNEGVSRVGTSMSFAAVAIGELMNMLNIAVYGEYFITLSEDINREIYFTPWYKFDLRNRKMIRQFLVGTHKPMSLSTWFVRMDMEMFSSVMHTAYSFFNFIKLSKTLENS
ncbi:Odorant receptor [Nesidiocoris tenuis]|uniref:Odorant receptor n=1 Tax=Nesidiocoris tenuis TaxID=355587 RepID=A0ABN7AEP1_9HEMI|nr:Odorant receptor [Nesidiocoris tenuis]